MGVRVRVRNKLHDDLENIVLFVGRQVSTERAVEPRR
jgi:hypothetical protein